MKTKRRNPLIWGLICAFVILTLGACGEKTRKSESVLDSPEHHVFNGKKLLDKERYDDALREFDLALQLDPGFAPAHTGKGLVYAYRKDFKKAMKSLDKGVDLAKSKEHKVEAHVGMIRFYSLQRGEGWLEDSEKSFRRATKADPLAPSSYFYMGKAYKVSQTMEGVTKASDMFRKVLDIDKEFVAEANREWEIVQKIQRAAPGSKIGLQIALIEKIDRADIAALFIQELKLEKLYKKRGKKSFDTAFKAPDDPRKFQADTLSKADPATDIGSHVLRTDMETVIELGVRGLEPFPDHTFKPDQVITRVEYAVMIEDILIKVTGDESLASQFIGRQPSFPDVRSDQWFFNAIELCNSRGIMKAVDVSTGEFRPHDPVGGADALLIIRTLKDELKFF